MSDVYNIICMFFGRFKKKNVFFNLFYRWMNEERWSPFEYTIKIRGSLNDGFKMFSFYFHATIMCLLGCTQLLCLFTLYPIENHTFIDCKMCVLWIECDACNELNEQRTHMYEVSQPNGFYHTTIVRCCPHNNCSQLIKKSHKYLSIFYSEFIMSQKFGL